MLLSVLYAVLTVSRPWRRGPDKENGRCWTSPGEASIGPPAGPAPVSIDNLLRRRTVDLVKAPSRIEDQAR